MRFYHVLYFILRASPRAAGPLALRGKKRGIIALVVLVMGVVVIIIFVVVVLYFTCLEGSGRLNLSYFTCLEGSGRLDLSYFTCLEGGKSII